MRKGFLTAILFFSLLSLFAQNSTPGPGYRPIPEEPDEEIPWVKAEAQVPYLYPRDFQVPDSGQLPLFNELFPGENPAGGYWTGISLFTLGAGGLCGSLYYSFREAQDDINSPEFQAGITSVGVSLITMGLSSLIMDYFRELNAPSYRPVVLPSDELQEQLGDEPAEP